MAEAPCAFERLGLAHPIVQAPMAGVSTPALAAAVSNAGALGSISVGAMKAAAARQAIAELRGLTDRPFNINLFVHAPPCPDAARETAWLQALAPLFRQYGTEPPTSLRPIYESFHTDDAMLGVLLESPPPVVSFHFGLPDARRVAALKAAGCTLLATATSLAEARAAARAGMDAVIAQGYEAGGHRGMFDPLAPDEALGTATLTRLLVLHGASPVIAAGGILDGRGIAAMRDLGAVAAQLGTAFIACPESSADAAYRQALTNSAPVRTVMTDAISGRPARSLVNRFTEWGITHATLARPDYPIAYDAGKALNQAAKTAGEAGYGAQWAGQELGTIRSLPAAELIAALAAEMRHAAQSSS